MTNKIDIIYMTKIFELTKEYVEHYELSNNEWFSFANKCSQEEFLKSQEGFYYAVKAFPRILSKLASNIDSSEARLLIIENLWEEHGHGNSDLFHTNTYFQYLQSLGFNKKQSDIQQQPWVSEWITNVLNKDYSEEQYAMYIAGIEYIYARISKFIANLIENYSLFCSQNHYANHAVLDYEHSKELIITSLLIQKEKSSLSDEEMMYYFKLGISEFLILYENMILLTELDAIEICKEKYAFYYGREDTSIAKNFLQSWYDLKISKNDKKPANVLTICSGGENTIDLLSMEYGHNITLLDINQNQLSLAKEKIESIKKYNYLPKDLMIFNTGKFEKIFTFVKNSFTYEELKQISLENPLALNKFKWICDNAFSNRILEIVFTDNATKYSKDNFADHFYNLFVKQIKWYFETKPEFSNVGSIFFDTAPINYQVKINPDNFISYYNGDFLSFFKESDIKFDLIDLSNISDWMPFVEMQKIVSIIYSNLNKDGVIVGRKLLGDYKWIDLQKDLKSSTILHLFDCTSFYSECVLIKKL